MKHSVNFKFTEAIVNMIVATEEGNGLVLGKWVYCTDKSTQIPDPVHCLVVLSHPKE